MSHQRPVYKRVLLKISGEALMGDQKFGVEHKACQQIADEVREIYSRGVQIGIVVGAGNIFRGTQAKAFEMARTPADHIGMLATTINGLVLQQALTAHGCPKEMSGDLANTLTRFTWIFSPRL